MDPPATELATVPADVKARLEAAYDAIAPTYNNWAARYNPLRLRYLDKLLDVLQPPREGQDHGESDPPRRRALELGCGAGIPVVETLLSSPRGIEFHVTGNDMSSTQIALARERLGDDATRVQWLQGDMMKLEFPAQTFDAVIALYSIIHLPRAEQDVLLGRIAGWLKPGGLLLANFSAEDMQGAVLEEWLGQKKGWMYWSGWGAEATLDKLKNAAGLEVVVGETAGEDGVDAAFLWVIARAPTTGSRSASPIPKPL